MQLRSRKMGANSSGRIGRRKKKREPLETAALLVASLPESTSHYSGYSNLIMAETRRDLFVNALPTERVTSRFGPIAGSRPN